MLATGKEEECDKPNDTNKVVKSDVKLGCDASKTNYDIDTEMGKMVPLWNALISCKLRGKSLEKHKGKVVEIKCFRKVQPT